VCLFQGSQQLTVFLFKSGTAHLSTPFPHSYYSQEVTIELNGLGKSPKSDVTPDKTNLNFIGYFEFSISQSFSVSINKAKNLYRVATRTGLHYPLAQPDVVKLVARIFYFKNLNKSL
jgi:hypothetical protein